MDLINEIQAQKDKWGRELMLLTHHYQRMEIADLGDRLGDSYQLSRAASEAEDAKYIVFCGVRFMAEAAEILRRPEQRVIHPVPEAGCPMADMATAEQAEEALLAIHRVRGEGEVTPIVYMNSSAELKALVGRHGGTVCTSSNAPRAFEWAFGQRDVVFFFPDEHLGRNSAHKLGIDPARIVLWDPEKPEGGVPLQNLEKAKVILWKGYCHVHTHFTVEDVRAAREQFPKGKVLVHPECPREVVELADGDGSTSYLVKAVAQAEPGSTLIIGTEINLIARLARDYPDRQVIQLKRSLCPNMFKISPKNLLKSLQALPDAEFVTLPEEVKQDARLALERMLGIIQPVRPARP